MGFSTFPRAPVERGLSRFSKALPLPPADERAPPPISKDKPLASRISNLSQSPLPPIPKCTPLVTKSKMSNISLPRRPLGGAPTEHLQTPSMASGSSVNSASSVLSSSFSDRSDKAKDSLGGIDPVTPPRPSKQIQRQGQTSILASPASAFQTSNIRPEIWQRRSAKSNRNIVLSELKLEESNGSTASPPRQPLPERDLPPVPSHLPRSAPKPVPARPAPPQPDLSGMGNRFSKLKDKTGRGSESNDDAKPQTFSSFINKRLPTPEYSKTDKQEHAILPAVLPPRAPDTPPNDVPPTIPQRSESRSTSIVTVVHDIPLANTTNRSNLFSSHSRDTSETLTITSKTKVMRSPQPQKASVAKILTSAVAPPILPFPRPATPSSPEPIVQGPELSIVHLECYQKHNLMMNSRNISCPTACMVCRKKEGGPRWRCSWCCLSACGSCMQALTSIPGRDLRICLERVVKKGEGSQHTQLKGVSVSAR